MYHATDFGYSIAGQLPSAETAPKHVHWTREAWLHAFIDAARAQFSERGRPLPDTIRVGVGFPSRGKRSNTIGECWYSEASADNAVEIFLRPSLQDDAARVAGVLTHELCHAALGAGHGHGPAFKKLAKGLGLEGPMKATTESDAWREWALPILENLGAFPGAALNDGASTSGPKKQTTRYLKVTCTHCDWQARVTAKHISDDMHCPVDGCDGVLQRA